MTFTWDPVADRGDGAGQDLLRGRHRPLRVVGHGRRRRRSSRRRPSAPRVITQNLSATARTRACTCRPSTAWATPAPRRDRVRTGARHRRRCRRGSIASRVIANPSPSGSAGFDTWLWLTPSPAGHWSPPRRMPACSTRSRRHPSVPSGISAMARNRVYRRRRFRRAAYPRASSVTHTYEAHSQSGYVVRALVRLRRHVVKALRRRYMARPISHGHACACRHDALAYPVEQAQPELVATGP